MARQTDILFAHGCGLIQVYVFSKPLPADEVAVMLMKDRIP
jgi:EAL domain-containing protein (putative c-di-GMP-specific phosphodiesterase class I)